MAETILLEIVTPDRLVLSEEVDGNSARGRREFGYWSYPFSYHPEGRELTYRKGKESTTWL